MHLFTIHLFIIHSFINHPCMPFVAPIFLPFTNQHIYTIHLFIYSTPIRELFFYFVYTKSFTRHSFIIRFINFSLIIKSINQHLQKLSLHECTFQNNLIYQYFLGLRYGNYPLQVKNESWKILKKLWLLFSS